MDDELELELELAEAYDGGVSHRLGSAQGASVRGAIRREGAASAVPPPSGPPPEEEAGEGEQERKRRRLEEIAKARAAQEAENKRLAEERRKRLEARQASQPSHAEPAAQSSMARQMEALRRKIQAEEARLAAAKAAAASAQGGAGRPGVDERGTAAASVPMIAVILAGTAAMTLAPAALAEDVRTTSAPEGVRKVVCASNPTSKLCLEGSYKRGQAPSLKN
ncbi:hypothetical protein F751_3933 [Auxenochlorella protothecoides]|uniref:Uncharacterized protein n=1 Tax=Auxenochlorella protothecoides TaxID=3075 RepID=A0A087SHP9_AUXPR|nr:hypothetical protein F751_3933 [Auxenochlorella protothecoides]KFM25253.1 hypothetical protein F751_3933 [Auxenochlorella protothecoides]